MDIFHNLLFILFAVFCNLFWCALAHSQSAIDLEIVTIISGIRIMYFLNMGERVCYIKSGFLECIVIGKFVFELRKRVLHYQTSILQFHYLRLSTNFLRRLRMSWKIFISTTFWVLKI